MKKIFNIKSVLLVSAVLSAGFFIAPKFAFAETSKSFEFNYEGQKFKVGADELNMFALQSELPKNNLIKENTNLTQLLNSFYGTNNKAAKDQKEYSQYNLGQVYQYLKELSSDINRDTVEPLLKIQNEKVSEFTPPQKGVKLDIYASALETLGALKAKQTSVALKVNERLPQKSLSTMNSLGINELLAKGESNFKGSPKNRMHNIEIGVNTMKGVIIKPGEEFSFNKYLGPVEKEQGFLPELVIKKTGTVPELGGGLCQVSSTTFRAAMNAGLPITERRNHAYAVQYYAPQGTDATIYPGVVDLKFVNDTPGSILIWPYIKDKYTLIFEFYGTKDNRAVTLEKPYQYDRQKDGSMKATWVREVTKDGKTTTDTFKSTYLPPELFHKPEATSTVNSISSQPAPSSLN